MYGFSYRRLKIFAPQCNINKHQKEGGGIYYIGHMLLPRPDFCPKYLMDGLPCESPDKWPKEIKEKHPRKWRW